MKCPYCGYVESKVIDSRPTDESERIRRRRECLKCERRFTTYEVIETTPLVVIKKDKSREGFDSGKLLAGLVRACEKRPVPLGILEDAVRAIDEVAYVRFASVYRQFKDIDSFMKELQSLLEARAGRQEQETN